MFDGVLNTTLELYDLFVSVFVCDSLNKTEIPLQ